MTMDDLLRHVKLMDTRLDKTVNALQTAHDVIVQHDKAIQLCAETMEGARLTILEMQKVIARQNKEIDEIFKWVKSKLP